MVDVFLGITNRVRKIRKQIMADEDKAAVNANSLAKSTGDLPGTGSVDTMVRSTDLRAAPGRSEELKGESRTNSAAPSVLAAPELGKQLLTADLADEIVTAEMEENPGKWVRNPLDADEVARLEEAYPHLVRLVRGFRADELLDHQDYLQRLTTFNDKWPSLRLNIRMDLEHPRFDRGLVARAMQVEEDYTRVTRRFGNALAQRMAAEDKKERAPRPQGSMPAPPPSGKVFKSVLKSSSSPPPPALDSVSGAPKLTTKYSQPTADDFI
jgi:hypothetical protein